MKQQISLEDEKEPLERIAVACQTGLVLVDAHGEVVWVDHNAKRRVNGELRDLHLPLSRADGAAVDCFVSPVDLTVNGERITIGVIQEINGPKQASDLMAAVETVVADSTSWFTRTVMEKIKAIGQVKQTNPREPNASDLDLLSDREREVLGLICEGHTDAQMGDLLGLSENTVRNHIASLYRKIGVNRRTAAIIWARERGISSRAADSAEKRRRRSRIGSGKTQPRQ